MCVMSKYGYGRTNLCIWSSSYTLHCTKLLLARIVNFSLEEKYMVIESKISAINGENDNKSRLPAQK